MFAPRQLWIENATQIAVKNTNATTTAATRSPKLQCIQSPARSFASCEALVRGEDACAFAELIAGL